MILESSNMIINELVWILHITMNYDKVIKSLFLTHDKRGWDKIESNRIKIILSNKGYKYINIYNYIINRYNDYENIYDLNNINDIKLLFRENLIRIIYNINERPICKKCGRPVHFNGKKSLNFYHTYCSNSCSNSTTYNPITLVKQYEYNLKHYGVKTNFEIQKCKDKRIKTINKNYGDNAFKLFSKKCKETCIERYGVDSPMKLDSIKEKQNKTCKLRYGSKYYTKTKEYLIKSYNTRKQNKTFNSSKPEEQGYKLLYNKFGFCNVIRQYKSELYPYCCDFYIKYNNITNKDLYIEFNFFWTHGKHRFDINNKDDINILNKWKEKSKEHKMYANAIKVWAERDIKKQEIAKRNNLNYLTFYNMKEFNDWYSKLK